MHIKHIYDILSQYIIPKVTVIYLSSCTAKKGYNQTFGELLDVELC